MREINSHNVNETNNAIKITTIDNSYSVELQNGDYTEIKFQTGPIHEVGQNGITNEVLLTIVIDRIQQFQKTNMACRENAIALTKLEEAQMWLQKRTQDRINRGVEGTRSV